MQRITQAKGEQNLEVGITLVTRDGKRIDLGVQKPGSMLAPLYALRQAYRIRKYVKTRRASITDPKELVAFDKEVARLKEMARD